MKEILEGALRSKTMWANGLITVASVVDVIANNSGVITALWPAAGPILAAWGVVNMALRTVTTQRLADK